MAEVSAKPDFRSARAHRRRRPGRRAVLSAGLTLAMTAAAAGVRRARPARRAEGRGHRPDLLRRGCVRRLLRLADQHQYPDLHLG